MARSKSVRIGAIVGLVLYLGLFVYALATSGGFSVMGVKNEALTRLVKERYLGSILLYQIKVAGAYAAIGLILGGLLGWAVHRILRPASRRATAFSVLSGLGVLHLYIYARGVILQPQLYTERLYDSGGLGRWLQVFLTDRLSMTGLNIAALLVLTAAGLWLFRPSQIPLPELARLKSALKVPVGLFMLGLFAMATFTLVPNRIPSSAVSPSQPNVVMIVVDSMRYDHLSCHGYARPTTPAIDELCRQGFDFEQAYVSLPRTFPSLVTMLTGLYPERHGVRHMFPTDDDRDRPLPGLPRALKAAGYQSRAISDFSGDILTRVELGFDRIQASSFNLPMLLDMRGLEIHPFLLPYLNNRLGRVFFPELREFVQASDPAVLGREAEKAIGEMKGGPFFLLVFFSTPHFPYAAPYPDYRRFTNPGYDGKYKYHKPNLITTDETVNSQDIEQIRALYDGAVHSVDREVGRIVDALRREGLLEHTMIMVTADHGEHLYESDRGMGHGEHLRGDNVLRVPLIIRDPLLGRGPTTIGSVVRSVDLVPTLLDRLGLHDPVQRDGVSVMPVLRGEKDEMGLPAFAETGIWFVESGQQFFQHQRLDYPNVVQLMEVDPFRNDEIVLREEYRDLVEAAKHRMILKNGYKLISVPTRQGVRYELYDHAADPEDQRPLDLTSHPEVFKSLRAELWAWMERDPRIVVRNGYLLPNPESSLP